MGRSRRVGAGQYGADAFELGDVQSGIHQQRPVPHWGQRMAVDPEVSTRDCDQLPWRGLFESTGTLPVNV
jgi:hypothetical protein